MKMDLGISGKTAIVTGGAVGIGRAIAEEFAQNGMRVAMVDRSAEHLGASAKRIASQFKTEVLPMVVNVADPAEPARVVACAFERFGSVDVLVNNAGRAHAGGILDASDADWQDMTETKLSAMRRFCQAVIPHMRTRHWGRIINIS
jgi:3-oxoacyl-[acyl-carrier protein] reductase